MQAKIKPSDRALIEAIRNAQTVHLIINEGTEQERRIYFSQHSQFFKSFLHDLRITVQSYIGALYNHGGKAC